MKKFICLALVLVSLIGVLSGCCCLSELGLMEYECENCGGTYHGIPKSYYVEILGKSYDVCGDCYDYLTDVFG